MSSNWAAMLMSAWATVALAQSPGPRLLAEATVSHDEVTLADLLPSAISGELRDSASQVDLGRAPQPGMARVFRPEQLRARVDDRFAVEVPPSVIVRREGRPVRMRELQKALRERCAEVDWTQARVNLPSELVTRSENAEWKVVALQKIGPRDYRAELRCRENSECGVYAFEFAFSREVPNCRKESSRRVAAAPMVKPGRITSLEINAQGMRLTSRVRPLQAAHLGEQVRVMDVRTRRVLWARVHGENRVVLEETR